MMVMKSGAPASTITPHQTREPGRLLRRLKPRRTATRIALWVLLALLLVAVGAAGWALNRYVIDHVEISDVSTYESQIEGQTPTVPLATFPPVTVQTSSTYLIPPTSPTSTEP
jgi:hypothetical protein